MAVVATSAANPATIINLALLLMPLFKVEIESADRLIQISDFFIVLSKLLILVVTVGGVGVLIRVLGDELRLNCLSKVLV